MRLDYRTRDRGVFLGSVFSTNLKVHSNEQLKLNREQCLAILLLHIANNVDRNLLAWQIASIIL